MGKAAAHPLGTGIVHDAVYRNDRYSVLAAHRISALFPDVLPINHRGNHGTSRHGSAALD